MLSRIQVCNHTSADIDLIMTCQICQEESIALINIPHLFPTQDGVAEFNETVLQRTPAEMTIITAIDSPPSDITAVMQKLILAAAQNKDSNSTGNLITHLLSKKVYFMILLQM